MTILEYLKSNSIEELAKEEIERYAIKPNHGFFFEEVPILNMLDLNEDELYGFCVNAVNCNYIEEYDDDTNSCICRGRNCPYSEKRKKWLENNLQERLYGEMGI